MAYKLGTANGYLDLLFMLHNFVTRSKTFTNITYNPANTGDGFVSAEWADDSSGAVDDTWTIALDSGGTTFTVTGADSSHGVQSTSGTVGVPYVSDNGEIGFTLAQGVPAWVSGDEITITTGDGMTETQKWATNRYNMVYDENIIYNPANTGNGSIGNPNYDINAPEETWTISFTSATTFDVSGESGKSGAQASGTVGVAYDNGIISFTITAGGVAWLSGDVITVSVPEFREIMWEAPGNGGSEEIFMGIQTYHNLAIYQWKLNGYTGFNPPADFDNQPGSISQGGDLVPRCIQQDREMPYWLVANGRRVLMFYEVNGVYECLYMGFLLGYGHIVEQPYPMAIGGTTTYATHETTTEDHYHRAFFSGPCSGYTSAGANTTFRCYDGTVWYKIGGHSSSSVYEFVNWTGTLHGGNWPYVACANDIAHDWAGGWHWDTLTKNIDGSFPLFPIIPVAKKPTPYMFGEIHGLWAVPRGDTLNGEDTTIIGPSGDSYEYVFFPDTNRIINRSWCCLKLE